MRSLRQASKGSNISLTGMHLQINSQLDSLLKGYEQSLQDFSASRILES